MKTVRALWGLFLISLTSPLSAQQPFLLELPTNAVFDPAKRAFWVDSLIDGRVDKTQLGELTTDYKTYVSQPVAFKTDLVATLLPYLKTILKPPVNRASLPLVMEVKTLQFKQIGSNGSDGGVFVVLEANFYRRSPAKGLVLVCAVAAKETSMTPSPVKNMWYALQDAFSTVFRNANKEWLRYENLENNAVANAQKQLIAFKMDSIWNLPNRRFYIAEVLDARSDTTHIGIVQKGLNSERYIDLQGGFLPALRYYLFSTLPNYNEQYEPLTMKIGHFLVSTVSDVGRFEMEANFYRPDSSEQSQPIFSVSINEDSRALGLMASHPDRIKKGILRALAKLNEYLSSPEGRERVYEEFDRSTARFLKAAEDVRVTYSDTLTAEDDIRTCEKLRSGIYVRYNELKTNRPSINPSYVREVSKVNENVMWINDSDRKRVKANLWGLCDGHDVYIHARRYNIHHYYCKVLVRGSYLAWRDGGSKSRDMNGAVLPGAAIGGLVGGLLVGALMSSDDPTDCLLLDTATGSIALATRRKLWELCVNEPDLLQRLSKTGGLKSEERLEIIREYNRRHPQF